MAGTGFNSNSRPYQVCRVDENQPEIVKAFRRLGYSVALLHRAGEGVFDILIGKHGLNVLVEIKDGAKDFYARQFTKKQRLFNFAYQGMKCVCTSLDDVMAIDEQFTRLVRAIHAAGIVLQIEGCKDPIYNPSLS